MNSLRLRLSLGAALVAIVPIAIVVLVMGQNLRGAVRRQSAERLSAALGALHARLDSDARTLSRRLELLAGDAQLKRQFLVDSPGEPGLRENLAAQQFLLGLDYLCVTDTSGAVVADAAAAATAAAPAAREPEAVEALPAPEPSGPALVPLPEGHAVALDAFAPIRYREQAVGRVRGGLVLDSLRLSDLRATGGVELVLRDGRGRVLVSTLGADTPAGIIVGDAPARIAAGHGAYLARTDTLALGGATGATLTALVSTAGSDDALAALRVTSIVLALLALAVAVLLGTLWSSQVSRPVERLAEFSQGVSRGEWDAPLEREGPRELRTLVDALERMRDDLRVQRERLAAGERQAAYGQMARKVAHEIKNPLTPIAVSVADLKRSFDQQRPDFPQILDQAVRTIDEEVHALKRLLHEFSEFGRFPQPVLAPCALGPLLADIASLHAHEAGSGRLALSPVADAVVVRADRDQLRRALVNLVQNGLEATPDGGHVRVAARAVDGTAEIVIADDGPGLSAEQRAQLFVPGFTTKAQGSGLGLTIVERIVTDHGGTIGVESAPGRGTTFTLRLPLN